jgi:hypothetical protein
MEDISDSKVFPTGCKIYRRDQTDRIFGRVFLAVKSHLNCSAHTFDTNQIESVWCTMKQKNHRNIHICSFYRPPNSKIDVLYLLENQISSFTLRDNKSVIFFGGYFNLPDINWITNSIETNSRRQDLSGALINTFSHHSLTQVANKPTIGNTIFDLLASVTLK